MKTIIVAGSLGSHLAKSLEALADHNIASIQHVASPTSLGLELAHHRVDLIITEFSTLTDWGKQLFEPLRKLSPASLVMAVRPLRANTFSIKVFPGRDRPVNWTEDRLLQQVLTAFDPDSLCCLQMISESKRFALVLESDPTIASHIAEFVEQLVSFQIKLSSHEQIGIRMAVSESLTNAIVHGNLEIPYGLKSKEPDAFDKLLSLRQQSVPYCERQIVMSVQIDGDQFECRLTDEGSATTPADEMESPSPSANVSPIRNGFILTQTIMDSVEWNSSGHEMIFTKRLTGQAQDPHPATAAQHLMSAVTRESVEV